MLNWEKSKPEISVAGDNKESIVYFSKLDNASDDYLQKAVQETVDKAISLFNINVLEDSRYFICEWDVVYSTLKIVVSDDLKQNDSKYIVKCLMSGLNTIINKAESDSDKREIRQEQAESIKYWISNYLTTNAEFMQYSLIALYQTESRDKTQLL